MTYLVELKQEFALRILKELAKADALTLKKFPKQLTRGKEDAATLKLMAEADFAETVSEEEVFDKLRRP